MTDHLTPLRERRDELDTQILELTTERDRIDQALAILDGETQAPAPKVAKRATKSKPRNTTKGRRGGQKAPAGSHPCTVDGCGKTFKYINGLTRHLNQTHGIKPNADQSAATPAPPKPKGGSITQPGHAPSQSGQHECDTCGQSFTWRTDLAAHRREKNHYPPDELDTEAA